MKAIIYFEGLPGIDQRKKIGVFIGEEEDIKDKLNELQMQFSENKSEIEIKETIVKISDGTERKAFESFSDCDFSHVAILCGEKHAIKKKA